MMLLWFTVDADGSEGGEKMNKLEKNVIETWKRTGMISKAAFENGISLDIARKILVTNGIFPDELSREIVQMRFEGATKNLIKMRLNISDRVYNSHIGYEKGRYRSENPTLNAKKIRKWRKTQK